MFLPTLISALALAGTQDVKLPHNTFTTSEEGWTVYQPAGSGAMAAVTHDPKFLKVGTGSLGFTYKIATGQIGALAMPIEVGKLAAMNSMSFWVQADHETTLIVALQEHGGGRYTTNCHVPKGKWQQVQLSTSDFLLSVDPDSPKDPDNKLDPDQVESVAIMDIDEFLFQNSGFAAALNLATGDRSLYLSDFTFSDAKLAEVYSAGADKYQFDSYGRSQVDWFGLGLNSMTIASDSPFTGKWLRLDYKGDASHISGAAKALKVGALAGMKNLILQFGSTRPIQLLVQIEQINGAKFMKVLDVPGRAQSKVFVVAMSDLELSDDSPDKKAKMDLSNVKQIIVLDISGRTIGAEEDNTLYIGQITASK